MRLWEEGSCSWAEDHNLLFLWLGIGWLDGIFISRTVLGLCSLTFWRELKALFVICKILYNIIILFVPKQAKVVKGQVYRTYWWKRKLEETMKLIKQLKAFALCAHFSTGNVESYQKQPYLRKTGSFMTCDPCPSMPEGFVRFFRSMQTAWKDALLSMGLIRVLSFVCFGFFFNQKTCWRSGDWKVL